MAKRTLSVSGTFILQHLQLEDMRPKEDFRPGCKVDCIDRPRLHDGTLIRIDCDNRLGLVEWGTGHTGWWYLKDLTIVKKYYIKSEIEYEKGKSVIGNDGKIWLFMPAPKVMSDFNV